MKTVLRIYGETNREMWKVVDFPFGVPTESLRIEVPLDKSCGDANLEPVLTLRQEGLSPTYSVGDKCLHLWCVTEDLPDPQTREERAVRENLLLHYGFLEFRKVKQHFEFSS